MINSVIAALIAIFFWGKPDKKVKERIRKASLIRTIVYLVLTIFVLVFYIKSNQVATVSNFVNISNGRADYNSKGEVLDTVCSLDIYNKFSGEATYQNEIFDLMREESLNNGKVFAENSGIEMSIMVHSQKLDSIKSGSYFEDEMFLQIKKEIPDINHLFKLSYIATSIPTIFPVYPKLNENREWILNDIYVQRYNYGNTRYNKQLLMLDEDDEYQSVINNNIENHLPNIFENGLMVVQEVGTRSLRNSDIEQDQIVINSKFASFLINNLNIFTAADISQYAYVLSFKSELPIQTVTINYDVPIETQSLRESMKVWPNTVLFEGKDWGYFRNYTMMMYVKLPTMANLQLIRSFVLTTLLTLLISLFLRNFYYWIRKWTEKYKLEHRLPYRDAKRLSKRRITLFRGFLFFLVFMFFALILCTVWLVFYGHTILVSVDILDYSKYIILGIVVLVLTLLYILYRFSTKPISTKNIKKKRAKSSDSEKVKSNKKNHHIFKSMKLIQCSDSFIEYIKLFILIIFVISAFAGIGCVVYFLDKNSSKEIIDKACRYEEEGNYEKALDLFLKLANKGDASAQSHVGYMYGEGHGVSQNDREAVKWYRKAAQKNDAAGQYNLGMMYETGRGVEQNYIEAVKWYRKAAEQGLAEAQYGLSLMYSEGKGVPKSETEEMKWLQRAVKQKNADAQCSLALKYEYGIGVSQNYEAAMELYLRAAEQGNDKAQWLIGMMYENGKGVIPNNSKAAKWYKMAAGQGNSYAQWALGLMYEDGRGVEQNYSKALTLFRKAAEKGHNHAMNCLGILYATGKGVVKDSVKAVQWFCKAAELGDARAQCNLGMMYAIGNGMDQSYSEAVKWYRMAAEQGDAEGQYKLGKMYEEGKGVILSDSIAAMWYRKSAKQAYAEAQYILGNMYEEGRGVANSAIEAIKWYKMAAEQGDVKAKERLDKLKKKMKP